MALWNTTFLNPEVHTPPAPAPGDPDDTSWWDDLALFQNVWDAVSTVSGLGISLIDKGGDNIEGTMIPEYIADVATIATWTLTQDAFWPDTLEPTIQAAQQQLFQLYDSPQGQAFFADAFVTGLVTGLSLGAAGALRLGKATSIAKGIVKKTPKLLIGAGVLADQIAENGIIDMAIQRLEQLQIFPEPDPDTHSSFFQDVEQDVFNETIQAVLATFGPNVILFGRRRGEFFDMLGGA